MAEALLIIISSIMMMVCLTSIAYEKEYGDREYHEGWHDHQRLMDALEESPDDERLLEEMKKALKQYIRKEGLYEKGDVAAINRTRGWKEFKDLAWDLTVRRKDCRSK